jgi:hypothetical protein
MTQVFQGEVFRSKNDAGSGRTFEDMDFRGCKFEGGVLSLTRNPRLRTTVRNVSIRDCSVRGSTIGPAVIEDLLIDGLQTHTLLQTWGAAFRHVTLRGRVGRVVCSDLVEPATSLTQTQRAFDSANAAFYASVDWAIDITEASLEEIDLRGIPGKLVRRDPATSVLVRRENLESGEWREVDLSDTPYAISLQLLLESAREDQVLVAERRARDFHSCLAALQRLQDAGVADPQGPVSVG